MIWNETYECLSRKEMRELQGKRLFNTVERVYYNSPFIEKNAGARHHSRGYRIGRRPGKITLHGKNDLRDQYPFGLFSSPMSEIVRLHASSGTTGKPIVGGYTRKDLNIWSK